MTLFDPSPLLLSFIFIQRFVFFEVLGLLALLRLIVGQGPARIPAALALCLCLAAILTSFAPALNLQSSPLYPMAARLLASGGGTIMPLVASAVFATSLLIPSRRWRWIDSAHAVGVIAFLGLWVATRL
ncbi:hypothetical protein [Marivita sp. S2033]|uniref:hypothetical protein n=1 Tax=Marivita sp. S2033 TaxID=3373187 RepID=UPI00398203C2